MRSRRVRWSIFRNRNSYSDTLAYIFTATTTDGEIDNWKPAANQYVYQGGSRANPTPVSIALCSAYWGVFPAGGLSLLNLGEPASSTMPTTIALAAGWNGIGDPYTSAVAVSDLTFGAKNYTFAQATSSTQNLIWQTLYSYYQTTGAYSPVTGSDTLAVGNGYWICAFEPSSVTFPLPASTATVNKEPTKKRNFF